MQYKYMEADVKEAKRVAEAHKDTQMYQDIYKERLEILRKVRYFDEIIYHAYDEYKAPETKVELIIETIQYYMEEANND